MKHIMLFGILVTTLLLQFTICQEIADNKNDILEWYYNLKQQNDDLVLPRMKRQSRFNNNFDYDSNSNEDEDDWYVFDEVGPEPQTPSRGGDPNFNSNQFGWTPQQQNPSQGSFQGQQGSFQGQQGSFQGQQGSFQGQGQSTPNMIANPAPRPQLPNSGPPRPSRCVENCNSRTTSEYNPVCGSNGVTYNNMAKMNCAAACGIGVQFQRIGRCAPFLPPP